MFIPGAKPNRLFSTRPGPRAGATEEPKKRRKKFYAIQRNSLSFQLQSLLVNPILISCFALLGLSKISLLYSRMNLEQYISFTSYSIPWALVKVSKVWLKNSILFLWIRQKKYLFWKSAKKLSLCLKLWFFIPISLQPNVVDLLYFKLSI